MAYNWGKPETLLGRWSVGLNAFFLIVVAASLLLVATGTLNFNDRWWDVTVFFLVVATIAALITGILAIRRKDRSAFVLLSIFISTCTVLFILLHSLFISD